MKKDQIYYGRTKQGQEVYCDVYFSSLSAKAVALKHKGLTREGVLRLRKGKLRKQALAERSK